MSTLLSPSESLTFNSFLSSVELGDILTPEWHALVDSVPVPTATGREALTKATKDLMSLEPALDVPDTENNAQQASEPPGVNSNWPSLPPEPGQQQRRAQQNYTYGFGAPRPSPRPFFPSPSPNPFSPNTQAALHNSYNVPRSHTPAASNSFNSPSPFFPSVSEASSQGPSRPGPFGASSAQTILNHTSSLPKRPLPPDSDAVAGPSGANAKRRRPSVVTQDSPSSSVDEKPQGLSSAGTKSTRSASISSLTAVQPQDGGSSRPALLSPSQKRANHIQSEQKRRANIRKGYEALCDVVPALKEAIRMEEEAARIAEDDKEKGRKRKRKSKAMAAQPEESYHSLDGRAGPKSENVVLQKTIDHLHALLAERAALKERYNTARAALSSGHPALQVSANHLDDNKVPLWEREWNGGSGWNDEAGDDD